MLPLLKCVRRIGQTQLVRHQIAHLLEFDCQLDAHLLHQSLSNLNKSIVNDVVNHYRHPERYNYPSKENPLLFEITNLIEACGMDDPFQKVYITSLPLEGLPQLLFLFLISYLPKVSEGVYEVMYCVWCIQAHT